MQPSTFILIVLCCAISCKKAESSTNLPNSQSYFTNNIAGIDGSRYESKTLQQLSIQRVIAIRGGAEEVSMGKWVSRIITYLKGILFGNTASKGKRKSPTVNHLEAKFRPGDANARIQKELRAFMSNPPGNCKVSLGANIRVWIVTIIGAKGTIYEGEKYKLKFTFPKEYPSKPPSVYFLKPTPKHQHVYTNGDICLSLLGKDWRPNMTAESLAVSILSMLSSAKEKKMPQDNAMHADAAPGQQQDNWMYHDDKC